MNFTKSITKHITKLVGTLKSDEELEEILKKRFTKREFKTFVAYEEGKSTDDIKIILREEDAENIEKQYKTAIKKLNQEILKKELVDLSF